MRKELKDLFEEPQSLEKTLCRTRYAMSHPKLKNNTNIQSKLLNYLGTTRMTLFLKTEDPKILKLSNNAYDASKRLEAKIKYQ